MGQQYKVGDRVRLTGEYGGIKAGSVGTVIEERLDYWPEAQSVYVEFDSEERGHPFLNLLEPAPASADWQEATEAEQAVLKKFGITFQTRTPLTQIKLKLNG
jgi:hypothetical protein